MSNYLQTNQVINNYQKEEKIKLVIFDMDGTIFDTERLGLKCWKEAFKQLNIPVPEKVLYNKIGLNSKDSKELMKKESGIDFDYDAVKKLKKIIIQEYIEKNGVPIKKGFFELINFLKQQNIKTALATSRSHEMAYYYLEKAGTNFNKYFDFIVTGDLIENGKPNPDIFLYVSNKLNIEPKNCLIVEDSINGIKAGISANMKAIMIPDLIEPNEEIKTNIFKIFDDLTKIINVIKNINLL